MHTIFITYLISDIVFCFYADKLITCDKNTTSIDLSKREDVWIKIAEQINQPALINNRSVPPKKWTLYNSFFVAVTVASTIGKKICSSFILAISIRNLIKPSPCSLTAITGKRMRAAALLKRQLSVILIFSSDPLFLYFLFRACRFHIFVTCIPWKTFVL